jgi:hypothetical protein
VSCITPAHRLPASASPGAGRCGVVCAPGAAAYDSTARRACRLGGVSPGHVCWFLQVHRGEQPAGVLGHHLQGQQVSHHLLNPEPSDQLLTEMTCYERPITH